jgi:itaconate CoA-transferase
MSSLPLEDLLVVALEQAVAAPYCSSRLADAGARVIKIEREEGDFARDYDHVAHGESAYFVWLNRGKESLTLNIKQAADKALLSRLLKDADVFIQNLAPGAAARAGFDSSKLRADHPRLITVDISGYGEKGPYRDMKAYDLLLQAESGLASITGSAAEPGRVGVSVCDIACGMNAHAAVLQALIERAQTGKGQRIQVSLFDCIADWMTVPLLHQDYANQAPQRLGLNHPTIAPYGVYSSGAGNRVVLSIQNHREWAHFCEFVLIRADLTEHKLFASNVLRCQNRASLDTEINNVFSQLSQTELLARLKQGNIAYGCLNSVADLSSHSQLRRAMVDTPSGPVELVASPVISSNGSTEFGPVPAIGEHNTAIGKEFSDES